MIKFARYVSYCKISFFVFSSQLLNLHNSNRCKLHVCNHIQPIYKIAFLNWINYMCTFWDGMCILWCTLYRSILSRLYRWKTRCGTLTFLNRIFLLLCFALCYLHTPKKIVFSTSHTFSSTRLCKGYLGYSYCITHRATREAIYFVICMTSFFSTIFLVQWKMAISCFINKRNHGEVKCWIFNFYISKHNSRVCH